MQNELSDNLNHWDYIGRYSDWMYRTYSKWVGKKIFDVGAGMGRMVPYYLPQAEKIVATDIFQKQVDYMNNKFRDYSVFTAKKVDLLTDNLDEFKQSFDTVLCINVLEHLEDDWQAIKKMYSLLEPGGHLIIMVPAFQKLYCQLDKNVSHYRRYDRNVLKNMASELEMKVAYNGYFNALGIIPYYLKGKRHKGTRGSFSSSLNENNSRIYNFASVVLEPIERCFPPRCGLSEIIIIRKGKNHAKTDCTAGRKLL